MLENKIIPTEIIEVVNQAFLFYPELANCHIEFKFKRIKTSMAARPNIIELIFRRRRYTIYINKKKDNKFGVMFNDIPEKAKIGLIAHELAHIVDYQNKSIFEIAKTGFLYLIKKQRQKYEKEIDIRTIHHGAGWHLYEYTKYILDSKTSSEKYRNYISKYYLNSDEIQRIIETLPNENTNPIN